jgi:PhnB protein
VSSRLNPYLSFNGTAREAMEFYADVFGGSLAVDDWADYLGAGSPDAGRVGHAVLETEAGYTLMAGDSRSDDEYAPMAGVSVSLSGDDADVLRSYWKHLSADAEITVPMAVQPWGDEFGSCIDRFGVSWLVNIAARRSFQ